LLTVGNKISPLPASLTHNIADSQFEGYPQSSPAICRWIGWYFEDKPFFSPRAGNQLAVFVFAVFSAPLQWTWRLVWCK